MSAGFVHAALLEELADTSTVSITGGNDLSALLDYSMIVDYGSVSVSELMRRPLPGDQRDVIWNLSDQTSPTPPFTGGTAGLNYSEMSTARIQWLLELYPEDSEVLIVAAARAYMKGQAQQSIDYLDRVIQSGNKAERAAVMLSGILAIASDRVDSINRMNELILLFPDQPIIRFNSACLYARNEQLREGMSQIVFLAQINWKDLIANMGDDDLDNLRQLDDFISLSNLLLQQSRAQLNRLLLDNPIIPRL